MKTGRGKPPALAVVIYRPPYEPLYGATPREILRGRCRKGTSRSCGTCLRPQPVAMPGVAHRVPPLPSSALTPGKQAV